jgi:hypothetical protein
MASMQSQPSIVCPKCGMRSHNPNDVEQRYCGNCHAFHDDLQRLPPPGHPDAPNYWMSETSGVLKPVVEDYLKGKPLAPEQVAIMRAYLWQWVKSPVWPPSGLLEALRLRAAAIQTEEDVHSCINAAIEMDMDPL